MKNLTKLLTLIVVFCSVIISGCRLFGGYSEESVPATPPVPVFSVAGKAVLPSTPLGNKIAPADSNASEGISLTIRAQKAAILTGLQAVVVDMLGNRIGEPVPVDD